MSPVTGAAAGAGSPYDDVVAGVLRLVDAHVPAGAEVLVVSRGDPRLVGLDGRRGRHFPEDPSGEWAGHHPGLGAAAELLRRQRGRATHLVLPAPSGWWLETYPELAELLAGGRCLADEPGTARLWELPSPAGAAAAPAPPADPARAAERREYGDVTRHASELAAALVPAGDTVLVVTRGDPGRLEVGGATGRHFPATRGGDWAGHPEDDRDAVGRLAADLAAGAGWLLVPADADWWADAYPGFWAHLERCHRPVARRDRVGRLYRLEPDPTDARGAA